MCPVSSVSRAQVLLQKGPAGLMFWSAVSSVRVVRELLEDSIMLLIFVCRRIISRSRMLNKKSFPQSWGEACQSPGIGLSRDF